MNSARQLVTAPDLLEEAKKRIVIISICVFGLSYLMSLTSSSVWVNLPAAAFLIIGFRYFSMDFEMRRKAAAYNGRENTGNTVSQEKPLEGPKLAIKKDLWRKKVKSPLVEDAIDQFTKRLVSEWVTDLWYSKLTPDRDGPEELVQIINGVLGEISHRMRNINLIDLLTRDVIHIICKHLELYRACQAKIVKNLGSLSSDQRDMQLKATLAAEDKLHPLMYSAESEHKVLQHITDGLISLTFKPEDLHCSFFRYVVRELLACAVMRPVLNLANPRFINERIEQVVISVRKTSKGASTNNTSLSKDNGPSKVSSDDFSPFPDPSTGVELVELRNTPSKNPMDKDEGKKANVTDASKDPLLSIHARSSHSWSLWPSTSTETDGSLIGRSISGGQWGDMLNCFSLRKTQGLAPEHLENVWSKGINYDSKDGCPGAPGYQNATSRRSDAVNSSSEHKENGAKLVYVDRGVIRSSCDVRHQSETIYIHSDRNTLAPPPLTSDDDDNNDEKKLMALDETESGSSSHNFSEDEESRATGLDSPITKLWEGRKNRNSGVSHVRHPLESLDGRMTRRNSRGQYQRLQRQGNSWKRYRLGSQKVPVWQEVERTSFLSGDGEYIHPLKQQVKDDESSDDYDMEVMSRLQSGAAASSSASSLPRSFSLPVKSPQAAFLGDTFFKLSCEVLGANIVRSSSKTFAVYSISVTDTESNSWSIKRRYRHFEKLHRRLKEYRDYNLHLPPKHFLSSGLDVSVIRERCKLLDEYLKNLMQIPSISASIDVWDFLSIDSQTYTFSSAFSIVETLPVDLTSKQHDNSTTTSGFGGPAMGHLKPSRDVESVVTTSLMNHSRINGLKSGTKGMANSSGKNHVQDFGKKGKGTEADPQDKPELYPGAPSDPTFPAEWVPPNLSGPILDLVDVVLQLQEGAWIRRKAFWVAKQLLQLGMGDALDDWLAEKIQCLRKGSTVAAGIKRVEQILWPDGIFITKHPKRQRAAGSARASQSPSHSKLPNQISSPREEDFQKQIEQQEREAEQHAKFVYELMIDNAPAAIVSLLGRKEYEQCAKDLYFFLQSSVCLKQLTLDLLQLVLLCAFPELDHTFKQLREEKHKFGGELKST